MLWKRSIGRLNASSPTYYKNRLYIVNLVPGHVVKLDAKTGKMHLETPRSPAAPSPRPLVIGNTLYFGCEDDQLFALSTRNGHAALGDDAGRPGQVGARLPPTASSTSATTAAT